MIQAHDSASSLPRLYASFRQSGVSLLNCTGECAIGANMLTGIYCSTVVNNSLAEDKASFIAYKIAEANYTTAESDETEYLAKIDLLGFFISQICWVIVLWIVKCSIIAFYWRLFSGNGRSTRVAIRTIAIAVMCWGITVVRSPYLD